MLIDKIYSINPDILNRPIRQWNAKEFMRLQPFICEHFWQSAASIPVFRVVGTQHPDYVGLTWLEFLLRGEKMPPCFRLYEENPGYYYGLDKKEPTMYYQSLDGGDLYVGADGNHRTCIAKAAFYLDGSSVLHGVTVDDYRIDWQLKRLYEQIISVVADRRLPYLVEPQSEIVSRDDSGGWMLERLRPSLKIVNVKAGQQSIFDVTGAAKFLESIKERKLSLKRFFYDRH